MEILKFALEELLVDALTFDYSPLLRSTAY